MNRFVTSLFATSIVLTTAGAAFAQPGGHDSAEAGYNGHAGGPDTSLNDTVGSGNASWPKVHMTAYAADADAQIDQAVRHWKNGAFDVQQVSELQKGSERNALEERKQAEPQVVASLQKSIRANDRLTRQLEARNIEIGNIVGADRAADGGLTFYVE
jgi:hypothetical protein